MQRITADTPHRERPARDEHAALGWLALLPLVWLAWPFAGSPVRTALEPALGGAAAWFLATLPALGFAALTRHAPRAFALLPLAAYALVGFVALRLAPPSDTLEADRALLVVLAGLGLGVVGASTGARGRAVFVGALPWLALVFVGAAFADREHAFAGTLQNTGATSEAALAGALAGAWALATARGLARTVGALALGAYAVYVGLAPVLAGVLSLALALGAALLCARASAGGAASKKPLALGLFAALLLFGATRSFASFRAEAPPTTVAERPGADAEDDVLGDMGDTGGVTVRFAIWRAVPSFVRDHGALGAGLGQFRATFGPYRDPAEIALERRALGAESEVEHAHNDWLQGWCDGGLVGGLAWCFFLAWTAWNAMRALRGANAVDGALGLVALGLLANACLRAPLSWNAASAASFFFAAGALATRVGAATGKAHAAPGGRVARLGPWIVLGAFLALGTTAVSVLRLTRTLDHSKAALDPTAALAVRDDSVLAWSLSARELERQGAHATAKRAWQRVLDHRPFRVEAWVQLGLDALRQGERAEAERAWRRALALDPTQPAAARNLYVLALRGSERSALDESLATARGSVASEELVALAANATLGGRELGFAALQALIPDLAGRDGGALEAPARSLAASGQTKLADALDARLALVAAREFAAAGAWHDAVRLYRQALRLAKTHAEDSGAPLRLEFAAALARDGKLADAKAELADSRWSPDELTLVPEWAGTALIEFGLLAR
ncbi:MAG: tetratricopeptide repeat protein [Planctomycetes bacterium]|nr:tetratricopeptide repeat protein [Planctomycetota bacterium]